MTRSGKKAPIFWDSDGVDGGKSSLRVVLEWMTNPANYNKWRGSDRTSGKTKEALLAEIVAQLKAVGIEHRDSPGVRENINSLEKQWRQAEDFRLATVAGITDGKSLRDALLKRCPHYDDLHDVMMDRPSARTKVTFDDQDAAEGELLSTCLSVLQKGEKRPLAIDADSSTKKHKVDSVDRLLEQQADVLRIREEKRERMIDYREREHALKSKELLLKEEKNNREKAQADIDLQIKMVQLQTAQREAAVQLLLSRKQLQDSGVPQEEIDRLLPLQSESEGVGISAESD
ncbi:hypothetical protein GN244_ATG13010 [Phytophthora infestans]|uniref:Uncharacterized protein n=1 Tax=Phytophthora infestans TaxID=4787 RepID=A0A833T0N3_PHYIN|nr:hypothetical protein GN244_ATG13010 [Phytophthora infestans]KAF4133911.1 hypothetical protein GN958_ATG17248 [Phytophthora infestans]KAF4140241.1 hypothetical protein GN958_ATG10593 [Phytophthora infestans]KAF4143458.1 hypothetical protein GN958_ATG07191 [Phytophthora infestans]